MCTSADSSSGSEAAPESSDGRGRSSRSIRRTSLEEVPDPSFRGCGYGESLHGRKSNANWVRVEGGVPSRSRQMWNEIGRRVQGESIDSSPHIPVIVACIGRYCSVAALRQTRSRAPSHLPLPARADGPFLWRVKRPSLRVGFARAWLGQRAGSFTYCGTHNIILSLWGWRADALDRELKPHSALVRVGGNLDAALLESRPEAPKSPRTQERIGAGEFGA